MVDLASIRRATGLTQVEFAAILVSDKRRFSKIEPSVRHAAQAH